MAPAMTRTELEGLALGFTDAFNREDLDAVMAFFPDDGVYEEFDGSRRIGKTAIREAFVPQFRGDFGVMRFEVEDLFVDEPSGKALVRWVCRIRRDDRTRCWRGLDILRFEEGLLKEKLTYAKAERLRLLEDS